MVVEFLLILAVISSIILIHELGHALMGYLAGIRHIHIIAGIGRVIFKRQGFELRLLPLGGRCQFDAESHNALGRFDKILIALAGPAANLLLGLIFMAVDAPYVYVQLTMVLAFVNLVPLPRTDGWQALSQLINRPQLASLAINPWLADGALGVITVLVFL